MRYCVLGSPRALSGRPLRVAEADRPGPFGNLSRDDVHVVITASRKSAIRLPGGGEHPAQHAVAGCIQVGVVEDRCADLRPAQAAPRCCRSGRGANLRADRGRAGERDLVHVRVRGQRFAHRGPERHYVEDARREPARPSARQFDRRGRRVSDGLATIVKPAAAPGPASQHSSRKAASSRQIAATTPAGSRRV